FSHGVGDAAQSNFAGKREMDLGGDQLFRQRLAGIDVVGVHDVESEGHRRGLTRRYYDIAGGNKIDEGAALGSGAFLRRAEHRTQQDHTDNFRDMTGRLHFSPVVGVERAWACSKARLIASSMTDLLISPTALSAIFPERSTKKVAGRPSRPP